MKKTLSIILTAGLLLVGAPSMAAATEDFPICYGEPIPGTPAVPGIPAAPAKYEWVVTVPGVDREFYTEHEYVKEVKGDVQVKKGHKWERHNSFGWQDYPSVAWDQQDVPFLSSGPHSTVLEQWTDKGKEYRKVTTEYRYKKTGNSREITTREEVKEVREEVLVKPEIPAVPEVPAVPETPVVIDCLPTEEPTSPPTDTPVTEPPAPPVTSPPTSSPFPTPSPVLDTPAPTLPSSPASVSSPTVESSSEPGPTQSRPELAETGFRGSSLALISLGLIGIGIYLVKRRFRRV